MFIVLIFVGLIVCLISKVSDGNDMRNEANGYSKADVKMMKILRKLK